jgi:DNA-3-methyladenine glycosylase II
MKTNRAYKHLKKDPVMAKLIAKYGFIEVVKREVNLFEDILDSIVSQQLSLKAANTIVNRFKALYGGVFPTPAELLKTSDEKIRECGISYPKISYIKGVAEAIEKEMINLEALDSLPDEEVLLELVKLKGIGPWTSEMILIFSLNRPDVFSLGDLGLRNAISKQYGIDKNDIETMRDLSSKWSPYRTLAARYLWKSLENEI